MKFTGERLHSDINEYWAIEHYHRYAIASEFATSKDVLDIACGEGYGTQMLSKVASSAVGVDISSEAVQFAQKTYRSTNLSYLVGSASEIPLPDGSIDLVVSFETIEHHSKHHEMMKEIRRVLRPGGCLIISSPDKRYYSDVPGYKNPFHVKELYQEEFHNLVSEYFKHTFHFSQKTVYGSLLVTKSKSVSGFVEFTGDWRSVQKFDEMHAPVYNIAICSDARIDEDKLTNSIFNSEINVESAVSTALEKQKIEINNSYQQSRSFRIGKLITSPFRLVGNLFR